MTALTPAERDDLAARVVALADELIDPLICRTPAYGAPGHPHCAACCYGTGLIITDDDEQFVADTTLAMHRIAAMLLSADGGTRRMTLDAATVTD